MATLGATAIIELPPAGTLIGMAKRALPGVELLAVKTPNDINAARDLIATHLADPAAAGHGHLPEWRLVVAAASGTFRAASGPASPEGGSLGTIVARGGERTVTAPWPAEIIEWLAEDGDPVSEGQPLVRVLPRPEQDGETS
jgi:[acyl-carrier-protein] S-malonyltransferase